MIDFPSGTAISHYRLVAALRRSDSGVVYPATDARSGASVEIEIVNPELLHDEARVRRFVQESKAAARLHHRSLERVLDLGKAMVQGHEVVFVVVEPMAGETLADRIERRPDLASVLPFLRDAADGLAAAHAAGVLHRDLRPSSILVTEHGAKIAGFGRGGLTQPRMIWRGGFVEVGIEKIESDADSVAYLAPEHAEGQEIDFRADLFSFGSILYQAATGQHPFLAESPSQTIENIVEAQPKSVRTLAPDTPQQLDKIVRRCLAKRPDQRFGSTAELVTALDALLHGEPEPSAMPPPQRRLFEVRRLAAGAAAAIVLLGILLFVPRLLDDDPKPEKPVVAAESKETSIERLTETGDVVTAALSPDASILALVREQDGEQRLVVREVETKQETDLVSGVPASITGVSFSRDGSEIWYPTATGELFRIPTRGGAATRVMNRVHSPVTFSPDGRLLSFVRRDGSKTSLIVSDLAGKSQTTIAVRELPDELSTAGPAWAPASAVIACAATATKPFRRTTVIAVPVGRGAAKLVTDKLSNVGRLFWMPTGKSLIATTGGRFAGGGWVIDATRGQARRIVVDLDEFTDPTVPIGGRAFAAVERRATASIWRGDDRDAISGGSKGIAMLPDGSLLFAGSSEGRGLWWLGVNEETPRRLTEQFASEPAASSDGRFVVYYGGELRDWGLWRAKADGREAHLLVSDRAGMPREPQITPDGQWVVYTLVAPGAAPPTLWRVSIQGGKPLPITAVHAEMPAISSDGRLVAARSIDEKSGEVSLAIFEIDGGSVTRSFPIDPIAIGWTPDGSAIAFATRESREIRIQPIAGGAPRVLHSFDADDISRFVFASNGRLAAAVRTRSVRDAVLVRNFR